LNPAKQGRKAAFNRAGDAAQRSRWTFYEAIKNKGGRQDPPCGSDLIDRFDPSGSHLCTGF